MVFWIGILVCGVFVWLAVKMGFYETWAMLFNIVISIYLAVFLRPMITDISGLADVPYSNALTIIGIAIVSFLILCGISYICFTGQFKVSFPRILDVFGAAFLGFLAGFLVWSFVALLICIMPISQNTFVSEIGFSSQSRQVNISYVCWWCDLVNTAVFSKNNHYSTEQAVSKLLKNLEKNAVPKTTRPGQPWPATPDMPIDVN